MAWFQIYLMEKTIMDKQAIINNLVFSWKKLIKKYKVKKCETIPY